jgi:hypothetical protein
VPKYQQEYWLCCCKQYTGRTQAVPKKKRKVVRRPVAKYQQEYWLCCCKQYTGSAKKIKK